MLVLKVEALPGDTLDKASTEMIRLQRLLGVLVTCHFNGIEITAYAGSNTSSIAVDYRREMERKYSKVQT